MSMSLKYLVTLAAIFVPTSVFAAKQYWDRSLTILLAEGKEDCYFLPNIKATQEVDVEYQVRIYFWYFLYAEFYFCILPRMINELPSWESIFYPIVLHIWIYNMLVDIMFNWLYLTKQKYYIRLHIDGCKHPSKPNYKLTNGFSTTHYLCHHLLQKDVDMIKVTLNILR